MRQCCDVNLLHREIALGELRGGDRPAPKPITLPYTFPALVRGCFFLADSWVKNFSNSTNGTSLLRNQIVLSANMAWKPPRWMLEIPLPSSACGPEYRANIEIAGLHQTNAPCLESKN